MNFTIYTWHEKCHLLPTLSVSYDYGFAIAVDFLWWGIELEITH